MPKIQVDAQSTEHANRIIKAMVTDGYVSAKAVAELTGLSVEEATVLAESLNDDGRICSDELAAMEKAKGSGRLLGMARFIGTAPSTMHRAAQILIDTRGTLRCGMDKLGSENKSYVEDDGNCMYTLEGITSEESQAMHAAVHKLSELAKAGVDITPMLKHVLARTHSGGGGELQVFADKFMFQFLSATQKKELSKFIYDNMIVIGDKMEPFALHARIKILSQLGNAGMKAAKDLRFIVDKMKKKYADCGYDSTFQKIDEIYDSLPLFAFDEWELPIQMPKDEDGITKKPGIPWNIIGPEGPYGDIVYRAPSVESDPFHLAEVLKKLFEICPECGEK